MIDVKVLLDELELMVSRTTEYFTRDELLNFIRHFRNIVKNQPDPIVKFLFVEDGSVDTDELEEVLAQRNPEIKMIVYRQGSNRPELVDVIKI